MSETSTKSTAPTECRSMAELVAGLSAVRESPADRGTVELIVRRPETNGREVLDQCELDLTRGLVGDNWLARGSRATEDGSAHPGMQLNLMNARAIALIAGPRERWPLAGDQFYVDLDLGADNLPPRTRLSLGNAVIEVTEIPHLGCRKFIDRFGLDAAKFVNSEDGKALNLRGVNARVIKPGFVQTGDFLEKL